MRTAQLVDRVRLHLLERRGTLWLTLSFIAVGSYILGYIVADLFQNTLAEDMKGLELEHKERNEQAGEMLFLDQQYLNQVLSLARKLHANSEAWSSLADSSTEAPPPVPQVKRLLGLQTTSYQARSQEVVAGAHSLCALQGIQHGPHREPVACKLSSSGGRWALDAQKAQCSWICLN